MLLAAILSAWLQYAADGPQARAVVTDACPTAVLDGRPVPMTARAPAVEGFANVGCAVGVPDGTRTVRIGDRDLPPPLAGAPRTIAVLGDTGCRLKGNVVQGCNDAGQWPFPVVARSVAASHPDLIVHVGDYYYRETPCPATTSSCAGSPNGDIAAAWDADWFTPASPMLAAAPLVLVRGNHEDCKRGGIGWFRYLDAYPSTTCTDITQPYAVTLSGLRIVVLDSANADDETLDAASVAAYRSTFDAARSLASNETWLVTHRPPYTNATERAAMGDLRPFAALLAGHIHLFAALGITGDPPLIINGEGGDLLDADLAPFLTTALRGLQTSSPPFVSAAFGFALYGRAIDGWSISLRDTQGVERQRCTLAHGEVRC
jgi:predicted phosphodiesterase